MKPIILHDQKVTTRQRYELLRINEVHEFVQELLDEIDSAVAMVEDRLVPDGECLITIRVEQAMKPKVGDDGS